MWCIIANLDKFSKLWTFHALAKLGYFHLQSKYTKVHVDFCLREPSVTPDNKNCSGVTKAAVWWQRLSYARPEVVWLSFKQLALSNRSPLKKALGLFGSCFGFLCASCLIRLDSSRANVCGAQTVWKHNSALQLQRNLCLCTADFWFNS